MAIQNRRGNYADFDPSKMVEGEFAIVLSGDPQGVNGQAAYIAFENGSAKRLATYEDMQSNIDSATSDIQQTLTDGVDDAIADAQTAVSGMRTDIDNAIADATSSVSDLETDVASAITQAQSDIGAIQTDYQTLKSDNANQLYGMQTTVNTAITSLQDTASTATAAANYAVSTADEIREIIESGGTVASVFGRAGSVQAEAGDYNSTQITHNNGTVATALDGKQNTLIPGAGVSILNSVISVDLGTIDIPDPHDVVYGGTITAQGQGILGAIGAAHNMIGITAGATFDLQYPLLYAPEEIENLTTGTGDTLGIYSLYGTAVTPSAITNPVTYAPIYIVGTVSGTGFTVDSTTPYTQTLPNAEDGKLYLLVGNTGNSGASYVFAPADNMFAYLHGEIRVVAPTDVSILMEIGDINMGTSASTLTGAIAEHESDFNQLDGSIAQLKMRQNAGSSANAYTSLPEICTLLHFSDIHCDSTELQAIADYAAKNSGIIDDVICTGDMITYWSRGENMDYWDAIDGTEKFLTVIGNHDALASGTSWQSPWPRADMATLRQRFMHHMSEWGVIQGSSTSTYYYKDYTDCNLRLIVIDCTLVSGTTNYTNQLSWLQSTLSSARTAGLSVVIANHYEPDNPTKLPCDFTSEIRNFDHGSAWILENDYMAAVDSFQTAGGDFVCWLAGHQHCDFVCYNSNYPKQLFVVITCAYAEMRFGDQKRVRGEKSGTAFNMIAFDTTEKTIKIERVGANRDYALKPRESIVIDYANQRIVRQTSGATSKDVDRISGSRYSRYIKFDDGTMIGLVEVSWTGAIGSAWGDGLYYGANVSLGNWPMPFHGVPYITAGVRGTTDALIGTIRNVSETSVGVTNLYRGTAGAANINYRIEVIGIGRWK